MDSFKETRTVSYGGNIKSAFGGIVFGMILFIVSFFILWINESNNARQINIANYVNKTAIAVAPDSVNRANDNKLISLSSQAKTDESLSDGNITIKNALVLSRKVEMYQWDENKKTQKTNNAGGSTTETTTYNYEKKWSDKEINSANFHKSGYNNPKFKIKSQRLNAKSGKLGAFNLSETQTKDIKSLTSVKSLPQNSNYKIYDNLYYQGKDYANPQVGDIRVSYSYAPSGSKISLIGEQKSDNTITSMVTNIGTVYIQYDGLLSKNEIIEKFKQQNSLLTWIFRFVGWLVMFIGLNLIIKPLVVIASFIPFLSDIVNFATSLFMFLVSVVLSVITIGIAWLAYRPFMAILLFVIAFLIIFWAKNNIIKLKSKV